MNIGQPKYGEELNPPKEYSQQRAYLSTRPERVGGTARTNKILRLMEENEAINAKIDYSTQRAIDQRNERRAKRK